MSEVKESLSSFADNLQCKGSSEIDKILGKSILVAPSEQQYDLLLKRLKQQLGEGRGEVILKVTSFYFFVIHLTHNWNLLSQIGGPEDGAESGFKEDEMEAAVATLHSLASALECSCVKLRESHDTSGYVAQYLIRRLLDQTGMIFFYDTKCKLCYLACENFGLIQ